MMLSRRAVKDIVFKSPRGVQRLGERREKRLERSEDAEFMDFGGKDV
jgi:hypothetical protein